MNRFIAYSVRKVALVVFYISVSLLLACNTDAVPPQFPESLNNPSFEESPTAPLGWHIDNKVKGKGEISVQPHAGGYRLALAPNANNQGKDLLGVGQMLRADAFKGKDLKVSVNMQAEGGATAIVGVHVLLEKGDGPFVQLRQSGDKSEIKQDLLDVPNNAKFLIVYGIVEGKSGRAFIDAFNIEPKRTEAIKTVADSKSAQRLHAKVTIDPNRVVRKINPDLFGTNVEWIHAGQGIWDESKLRLKPDALKLAQSVSPTVIRFPGGVFSDTYEWKEGLKPHDKRPVMQHYPKGPSSKMSFGIQEVAILSKKTNSELMITVNVGGGTAQEAADWVAYTSENKIPVGYWEIGNELYMEGDLSGHQMSAKEYAKRYNNFAEAMLKVDPSLRLGAIGGLNYGRYSFIKENNWTKTVLDRVHNRVDFLAVHNAYAPVAIGADKNANPQTVYQSMLAAPVNIQRNFSDLDDLLRKYDTKDRKISVAVTEWGPFFHVAPSSPWVDHIKTLGSGLFVGSVFHTFFHSPRVEAATFFKLTDHGFMGWIGNKDKAFMKTAPLYAFELYRQNARGNVVETSVQSPTYDSRSFGVVDAVASVPYLDVATTLNGNDMSIFVVNKHFSEPITADLSLGKVNAEILEVIQLTGTAMDAHTGTHPPKIPGLKWADQVNMFRFNKGDRDEISFSRLAIDEFSQTKNLSKASFAPRSITCIKVRLAR